MFKKNCKKYIELFLNISFSNFFLFLFQSIYFYLLFYFEYILIYLCNSIFNQKKTFSIKIICRIGKLYLFLFINLIFDIKLFSSLENEIKMSKNM